MKATTPVLRTTSPVNSNVSVPEARYTAKNIDRSGFLSVDVVIPVYRPDQRFASVLKALAAQDHPIGRLFLFNTEKKYWDKALEDLFPRMEVVHIRKEDFDHGAVRHAGALRSNADIVVFMTQDALPADESLITRLIRPIAEGKAQASYARQLPDADAGILEELSRGFNYPPESRIRTISDAKTLGIRAFFCSNACAAYDRKTYRELGGFPRPVIFNEDMIFASKLLEAGYSLAYAADARVFHSHSLSGKEQLRRNFDLGVSQAEDEEFFSRYPSEGEGIKMVKESLRELVHRRKYPMIFPLVWISGCKFIGYKLGRNYKKLPRRLVLRITTDPGYWDRKERSHV